MKLYLNTVCECGGPMNTAIAVGRGIVRKDRKYLICNGEEVTLTKDWAKYLLFRMGLVKRKASTDESIFSAF